MLTGSALFPVLLAIAALIGVLLARGLLWGIKRIKNEDAQKTVERLVRAAAQLIPSKYSRYNWVSQRLLKRCPWLTEGEIEELIEAAVLSLKRELGQIKPIPAPVPAPGATQNPPVAG